MKTKKIKEEITLELTGVEGYSDCGLPALYQNLTYTYEFKSHKALPMPDTIKYKIKRKPETLREFIEVNEITEKEAIKILTNNLK